MVNVRDDMIVLKKINIQELVKSIVEEIAKKIVDGKGNLRIGDKVIKE